MGYPVFLVFPPPPLGCCGHRRRPHPAVGWAPPSWFPPPGFVSLPAPSGGPSRGFLWVCVVVRRRQYQRSFPFVDEGFAPRRWVAHHDVWTTLPRPSLRRRRQPTSRWASLPWRSIPFIDAGNAPRCWAAHIVVELPYLGVGSLRRRRPLYSFHAVCRLLSSTWPRCWPPYTDVGFRTSALGYPQRCGHPHLGVCLPSST
jgi:hypothetical protein